MIALLLKILQWMMFGAGGVFLLLGILVTDPILLTLGVICYFVYYLLYLFNQINNGNYY